MPNSIVIAVALAAAAVAFAAAFHGASALGGRVLPVADDEGDG